jgi:hypothetical protein
MGETEQRRPDTVSRMIQWGQLGALLLNAALFAYWIGGVESRTINNERRIAAVEVGGQSVPERLARLEALLETIREEIRRGQSRRE